MDKIFVIGHRGVGKTTLVQNFKKRYPQYECLDLDAQVEKDHQKSISTYFNENDEITFRNNEISSLNKIIENHKSFIVVLGAGFNLDEFEFPSESLVLWVRRETDPKGRIFLDQRPALTSEIDPLQEWQLKFHHRDPLYKKHSNAQITIPESVDWNEDHLGAYLLEGVRVPEKFFCTLVPNENTWVSMGSKFGLELRNDILSEIDIHRILKQIQFQRPLILAIRQINSLTLEFLKNFERHKYPNLKLDWDLKLGEWPSSLPALKPGDIISEHRNTLEFLLNWKKKDRGVYIYKFAPQVDSVKEAISLGETFRQSFSHGAYLPRSESMDLTWLRRLEASENEFNFFRFSFGTSSDQPLWFDLIDRSPKRFYAILGESVFHSYTPDFHKEFFKPKKASALRISIPQDQFDESIFSFLKSKNVEFIAVTSPYKNKVFEIFSNTSGDDGFKSVNTLCLKSDRFKTCNTDITGLQRFFQKHLDFQKPTVVWGGGSLLLMLKSLLPDAQFYSARSGDARHLDENNLDFKKDLSPVQLIWAAGDRGVEPCFSFKVEKVLDLDYKEDSKAKKWVYEQFKAKQNKIAYVNGKDFFVAQGLEQQKFWKENDI